MDSIEAFIQTTPIEYSRCIFVTLSLLARLARVTWSSTFEHLEARFYIIWLLLRFMITSTSSSYHRNLYQYVLQHEISSYQPIHARCSSSYIAKAKYISLPELYFLKNTDIRLAQSFFPSGNKTNLASPNITPGIYLSSGAIKAGKNYVTGTGIHALNGTLSGFSPVNTSMNTSVCYFAVQDTININYWACMRYPFFLYMILH